MSEEGTRGQGRAPAWIETVRPDRARGFLEEVYRGMVGPSGTVAHILQSQSLHPEALRDHYALYRTIMFGRGSLTRALREAIAVMVAAANGCRY